MKIALMVVFVAAVIAMGSIGWAQPAGDAPVATRPDKPAVKLTAEMVKRWGQSQIVFVGKLASVQAGPVGMSEPPMYTHTLVFQVSQGLRGEVDVGKKLTCGHVVRGARPTFPKGKDCLVAASAARGRITIKQIAEATPALLAQAKLACSVPMGWTVAADGKLASPWADQADKAWPTDAKGKGPLVCSRTGRPTLLVGGAKFSVAAVPPVQAIKWTNPDGDGLYEITIENPTDLPMDVPALLNDGKNILWDESLVILCQGKTYVSPLSVGVKGKVRPTRLRPHQKVSTRVNALALTGPEWPRGGYRIEFTFCLGEKGSTQSFYYLSRHHDVVREKALKELAEFKAKQAG